MKDLDMNDHTKQYRSIGGHRISISFAKDPNPELFTQLTTLHTFVPIPRMMIQFHHQTRRHRNGKESCMLPVPCIDRQAGRL